MRPAPFFWLLRQSRPIPNFVEPGVGPGVGGGVGGAEEAEGEKEETKGAAGFGAGEPLDGWCHSHQPQWYQPKSPA